MVFVDFLLTDFFFQMKNVSGKYCNKSKGKRKNCKNELHFFSVNTKNLDIVILVILKLSNNFQKFTISKPSFQDFLIWFFSLLPFEIKFDVKVKSEPQIWIYIINPDLNPWFWQNFVIRLRELKYNKILKISMIKIIKSETCWSFGKRRFHLWNF